MEIWTNLARLGAASLLVGGLAVFLGASPAKADVVLTLNNPDSGLSCCSTPGPYGTADVHLIDATHATVTFTAGSAPGFLYWFFDGGAVAVNVNASSWTLSNLTGNSSNGNYSDGGSGNEDGFGSFNQNINSPIGFGDLSTSVSFELTDTGGTWASDAVVLGPNGSGFEAAAHIAVIRSSGPPLIYVTGYAAATAVPEPTSLALLGSGLLALSLIRRRRKA